MDISTLPAHISEIYIQVVTSSPSFLKSKTPGWARRLSSLALDLFYFRDHSMESNTRRKGPPTSTFLSFLCFSSGFLLFLFFFFRSFFSLSLSPLHVFIYIYYDMTTLVCLKIAYVQFQWIIIMIPIKIVGRIPLTHPYYICVYIYIQFILSHAHTNTESSTRRWARGVCAGRSTSAATKPRSMAILGGNDPHKPTYVRDDMGDKCK